jgi:hypothetical protein
MVSVVVLFFLAFEGFNHYTYKSHKILLRAIENLFYYKP